MKKIFSTLFAAVLFAGSMMAGSQLIKFESVQAVADVAGATYGTDGFTLVIPEESDKANVDASNCTFGISEEETISFSYRLKTGGASNKAARVFTLNVPEEGTLLIYARTGSNSDLTRSFVLANGTDTIVNHICLEADTIVGANAHVYLPVVVEDIAAGAYSLTYPVNSVNFYGFELITEDAPAGWDGTVTTSLDEVVVKKLSDLDNLVLTLNGAKSIAILDEEECQYMALQNEDGSELYGIWGPTMGSTYTIEGNTITLDGFMTIEEATVDIPVGTTKLYIEDYGTLEIDGEGEYLETIELQANIVSSEEGQKIVVEQSEIAIYDWAAPEYNINTMAYPTDWTFQLTIVAEEGLAEGEYELGEFDNVQDADFVSHYFVAGSKITLTKGTAWVGGDCWIITGELETTDGLILDITLSTEPAKADVDLDKIVSENATVVCNFRSEKWSIEAETEAATLRLQFASSEYEGIYTVDTWGFGYDNLLVYGEDAADDIKAGSITAVVEGENVHVTGWVILHSYDTEMTYYVPVDLKGAAVEEDPAEGDELSDLTVTLNKVNMEDDGWALNFSASNEEGYELVLQFSWGVELDENGRLPEGELPITADQDIEARIIPSIEIPQGGFGPGPLSLEDEGDEVAVPDGSYITDGEKFWFLYEGSATISYNEEGKLLMVINAKNTAGNTLTITIDETAGGAKVYEALYEIGDNQGWNPAEAIEMTMLEENVFQGEFTFTKESNWFAFTTVKTADWEVVNANRFGSNPSGAEVKGDNTPVAITGIDGDYSFTIAAGTYTITVNINELSVSAEQTLGVENTKANGAAVKVLRGAQVIIVRDGAEYTILGNAL